ncbi:LamG-like jellyroll fold domain-containing protein [Flavobacterium gillisiae]|uniref:LamG-like jellyroll fold domain-containing protein n=1 Tax=Flavobacterium gillisiae TaxID=150146 RepID=UPI001C409AED|nr:LamG-like jellyroll fold domain-containing protein [Flavobacterium gillisiae]
MTWALTGATTGNSSASGINNLGTQVFNLGTTTVTYTVSDAANNSVSCSFTVIVSDNINPTITAPSNITTITNSGCNATGVTLGTPVTSDNCSVVSVTNNHPSTTYPLGTTTVIWAVTDGSSRIATAIQLVTVFDTTPPTISCPFNVTVNTSADGNGNCSTTANIGTPTINDNCSVSSVIAQVNGSTINAVTYLFSKGVTSVNWIVTDGAGNKTNCTQSVTVLDNEKPIAPSLPDITAQCSITVPFPVATDNCDVSVTATTSDNRTFNSQGSGTITWSFKDSSGNETIASQKVIIKDVTVPVPNVANLPALTVSGCQIDSLTPTKATDNCVGSINGTPNITFPFTTQGTTLITWTYNDGNGNIKTQTQNLTLTAPAISEGNLLGNISETYTFTAAEAKDNIAITSCPDDLNPITLHLEGEVGTIVRWEKFEAGNSNWVVIPNTENTDTFNTVFDFQNTKSTLFRVLIQVGTCTKYTNMVNVHAIPPDVPPILEQNLFTICLNDPVTLMAHNGYESTVNVGNGGDFNTGQFPDKWNPTQWRIDGQTAGAQWTASANATKFNNWSGTNDAKLVGTDYIILYDNGKPGKKFGIAHGNYNSTEYVTKYPGRGGFPTTLETPIFSLVGLGTAAVAFDQAYNLSAGDYAKLELSLDGGATYTITLQELIGKTPSLTWDWANHPPSKANNYKFENDDSSFDISDYIGNDNVRVRWSFFGTTDESVWAIDNITIPIRPYSDQLEWTDGIGDPGTPPLASGSIDVAYNFTPSSPGVHQYGATSLINACRAYDPTGTAIATVNVNYSYAGIDVLPANGKCGGTIVSLNAYDNTKTAIQNKTDGAYTRILDKFSDDPGTGTKGTWSVVSSTGNCGAGTFSNVNDSKATFTGTAGTYTLRWTVATCSDDVQVTLENCNVVDFDGEDDFVNFNNNYNLNNSFTISVWVKPETQPSMGTTIQTIFSKRNGDNLAETNGYDLRLDSNNFISFNWNNGSSIKSSHPISTSRWYHIGVTYTSGTYKLYIDGLEVASAAGSNPVANNFNSILGAMYHNGTQNESLNYYSGWMEELRIWNVALSPDQLHQMMNQVIDPNGTGVRGAIIPIDVNGLTWSNLIGYYRMDNLSCGYLKPYSGIGSDGRLININTGQSKTAPLPYTTIRNGNWKNRSGSTTPWRYGDTVWDYPNSTGVNGNAIDWNIVVESHDLNSDDKDITLLGLITNAGTKLNVVAPGTQNEINSGHMLWLTHYLKLDGFIDLVGESQLIQKRYYPYPEQYSESIFAETSSGYIERDQQGKKNSFNYNYWSSPVTIRGGTNNAPYSIPNVLMDGTTSSTPRPINFQYGAFDADGAVTIPIKTTYRWIWTYNSTTPDSNSDWDNYYQWNYVGGTGTIRTGDGFTMKGTGGTADVDELQNYVFSGKPNSGDIETTFLAVDQTYLIGNPYPCALDADEFIKNNLSKSSNSNFTGSANVFNGALYFWDHFGLTDNHNLAEYEGGYATYSLLGGVVAISLGDPLTANTGESGTNEPQRYIPVGQAFFVDATLDPATEGTTSEATTPGNLYFKNGQRAFIRETSGTSQFMKTSGSKTKITESVTDSRQKIRLGFDSSIGAHRQLLIGADSNTTNGFDIGYDAVMFDMNDNDMYLEINNSEFVIEGIPDFNSNQIIPLGIAVANEGPITIKIDALENIPGSTEIYLQDTLSAVYHNLRESDFEISLDIGEYNKRFFLRFTGKTLNQDTKIENGLYVYYSDENENLIIKNNIVNLLVNEVSLFNILGQTISNWEIENKDQTQIVLPVKNISTGIYIVKMKTTNGELSKKIIIP